MAHAQKSSPPVYLGSVTSTAAASITSRPPRPRLPTRQPLEPALFAAMEKFELVLKLLWWTLASVYYMLEALVMLFVPRSPKEVRGKVALVTGGGLGIGRLMCQKLAAKGATVVTWDIRESDNKETARLVKEAGGKCHAYTVDLCDRNAVYAAANKVKQEVGKVDILIQNAGVVTGKSVMESPDDMIQRTFDVNAISLFWTTKAFLGDMLATNKGHIVTVASMAGKLPRALLVDYCASKYAAVGFHESLLSELKSMGKTGVKSTVVCPIMITTGMFAGANAKYFPKLKPSWVADKVVEGIELEKDTVHLPSWMWIMVLQRIVLPTKSLDHLGRILKSGDFMKQWVGRGKAN